MRSIIQGSGYFPVMSFLIIICDLGNPNDPLVRNVKNESYHLSTCHFKASCGIDTCRLHRLSIRYDGMNAVFRQGPLQSRKMKCKRIYQSTTSKEGTV